MDSPVVPGGGTASAGHVVMPPIGTPGISAEQAQNVLHALVAAKALGVFDTPSSSTATTPATMDLEAQVGNPGSDRGDQIQGAGSEATPVAQVTHGRPGGSSAGQLVMSEALPAIAVLPAEPALLELALHMLTGGSGAPAAPAEHYEPAEASLELLVLVWSVVKTLKKEHAAAVHIVPGTNGRIDAEESRGYVLGAVLGRGLLTRQQAAAAGLDARNKKTAAEKRLEAQKETDRKATRKLSGEAREQHVADAATARAALERAPIVIELPAPPAPRSAVGRKRAAPPPSDPHAVWEVRADAWCKRRGLTSEDWQALMERKGQDAWQLRHWEQAWHPRTWRGRLELSQQRERGCALNRSLCTCDQGVPSFLCRVAWCYAFEALGTCSCERMYPGQCECTCMIGAWGDDSEGRAFFESPAPNLHDMKRWKVSLDEAICLPCPEDPMPMPPGGWPVVEPRWIRERRARAEAKALCKRHARMERMLKKVGNCGDV
jgi:hypothetical protein